MLVWFDTRYGAAGGQTYDEASPNAYERGVEYLIRVAADEQIPMVTLTMPIGDTTTKLRLRGTGAERKISSNGTALLSTQYFNTGHQVQTDTNSVAINKPSLSGIAARGLLLMRRGVLQLEKHITMQGLSTFDQNVYSSLVQVHHGTLIMKDGAAVKGHTGGGSTDSYGDMPIYLSGTGTPWSWFLMEGGEISGTTKSGCIIRFEAVAHATSSPKNRFQKTGGTIGENTMNRILTGNSFSPSSGATDKIFTIENGSGNIFFPALGSDAAKP
jgi:hypothetical protein